MLYIYIYKIWDPVIFIAHIVFTLLLQLANPLSMKPPLQFGTVPWTYTEGAIKKEFPEMYDYIKYNNQSDAMHGINAVKRG